MDLRSDFGLLFARSKLRDTRQRISCVGLIWDGIRARALTAWSFATTWKRKILRRKSMAVSRCQVTATLEALTAA